MPPTLVSFPTAAVDTAITELRRMAGHIDGAGGQLDTSRATVAVGWQGGHRQDFDVFTPPLVRRHSDLATQLRNLAGELVDAKAAVARENRHRTEAFEEAERQREACAPGGRVPGRPQIPC